MIQLLEETISDRPTLILNFGAGNVLVCYSRAEYVVYNSNRDFIRINDCKGAITGLDIGENQCLIGLVDGNGLLVKVHHDDIEKVSLKWTQVDHFRNHNPAILKMGFINQQSICCLTEDRFLQFISRSNWDVIKRIKLSVQVQCASIDSCYIVLASQNNACIFSVYDINSISSISSTDFKFKSQQQILIDGEKFTEHDSYWGQLSQINGTIRFVEHKNNNILILTDQGYFYHTKVLESSETLFFNIVKVHKFPFFRPLQLQFYNENHVHLSYQGSQAYSYDCQIRKISTQLRYLISTYRSINDQRELIASRFFLFSGQLIMVLAYKNRSTSLQDDLSEFSKIQNGKFKIIKCQI